MQMLIVAKQIKNWEKLKQEYIDRIDMLETDKRILRDIDNALHFKKESLII